MQLKGLQFYTHRCLEATDVDTICYALWYKAILRKLG